MTKTGYDVRVNGRVVPGYGVASGEGAGCPYPRGSLGLQIPIFRELGLDLGDCFCGTINVSTAPLRVCFSKPTHRFEGVEWTSLHPPENFSFVRCRVRRGDEVFMGWGYRPDPATKAEHFQGDDVVELLTGRIADLGDGDDLVVEFDSNEVEVTQTRAD